MNSDMRSGPDLKITQEDARQRHFSVTCLRDLFETVDNRVVIDFIKDIRFYSLLQYIILRLS